MYLQRTINMRISDSQREQLQFSGEELTDLQSLVEKIFDQNIDHGSSEDLQAYRQAL
jgi:hypothetical protein